MPRLENYVDVAARIKTFREKHPSGSIRPYQYPGFPVDSYIAPGVRIVQMPPFENATKEYDENGVLVDEVTEKVAETYLVYTAAVYRDVADETPAGIASAWELYPGRTPYTRYSELMNAETSAWGRAVVAALEATANNDQGIASLEEVEARQDRPEPVQAAPNVRVRQLTAQVLEARGLSPAKRQAVIMEARLAANTEGLTRITGASGTFAAFLDRELQDVARGFEGDVEAIEEVAAIEAERLSVLSNLAGETDPEEDGHGHGDDS
jgi:hypothetical protein